MDNKSFEILSADTIVAIWKNDMLTVIDDALLPLYLKYNSSAINWLETRAADYRRKKSVLSKKLSDWLKKTMFQ